MKKDFSNALVEDKRDVGRVSSILQMGYETDWGGDCDVLSNGLLARGAAVLSECLHEVVGEAKAAGMTPEDIKTVCTASCATDAEPYGETPEALLAMAKMKKG